MHMGTKLTSSTKDFDSWIWSVRRSSLTSDVSSSLLRRFNNSSAACCFKPAKWAASKSELYSRKCKQAILWDASDLVCNHSSESTLVWMASRVRTRYCRSSSTTQTMARNLRSDVSYIRSIYVSERDQYWIALVEFSIFFQRNTYATGTL